MKRIGKIIGIICAFPIIALAVILSLPFILVSKSKAAIALRVFRKRETGHVFLICTSKRSWHDFLWNNVIPVLPDNVRIVWVKSIRDSDYPELISHLASSHIFNVSKPYLVVVTQKALIHRSLNKGLQILKQDPKRSEDTRHACLKIINQELNEFRTNCCSLSETALRAAPES